MNEQEKYETLYDQVPDYRKGSPDVGHLKVFRHYIPKPPATLNIYGCGPGRAGRILADRGYHVNMVDIAANAPQSDVVEYMNRNHHLRFMAADLADAEALMPVADWGLCCDVMEHIPTARAGHVLAAIRRTCGACYFAIAAQPDGYGRHIGEVLHLTVQPVQWWQERLMTFWQRLTILKDSGSTFVFVCGRGG